MTQPQAKYLQDYQTPHFQISHLDLDISLAGDKTAIVATSKVNRVGDHSEALILDGEDINLKSVKINGVEAHYSENQGQLIIETEQHNFDLEIISILDPESNTSLEGLYMSDGAYCTQCEAEGFRRITYFLDRPDVLAIYTVRIQANKALFPFLLSNGNLVESGDLKDGLHYVKWHDPFPKPAYLFALVAGDFDLLEDEYITRSDRAVKLQVFVDKGNLHKAHHAIASLKKSMQWDETRFNLEYDLDIYMIVAVDFFNMGAMENKGLNVFNTKYVLADKASATDDDYHGIESVVGHEYFHNWTGNRVTCRDWFQLSLKEGLTVFRDQEFSSDIGSRAVNRIHAIKVMKNQQFAEDSGPMAHPIRPESVIEMNNFYTVTVYNKGAEVIRMIHTLLGEDRFQSGMALYFKRHDGQAVTCDDFVAAMEDASKVDLSQFRLWYSQAGTPQVTVTESFDESNSTYSLTLTQTTPDTPGQSNKLPLHIPFDIELIDAEGKSLVNRVLDFKEQSQQFVFDNLNAKPVVSLLQDFSAPVKLNFEYSIEQLLQLMRFASSEVAKWEASVSLFSQAVWQCVNNLQNGKAMHIDSRLVDGFKGVLLSENLNEALMAEILTLTSAGSLIEQTDSVDLDNLALARQFAVLEIAQGCEDELLAKVRQLQSLDSADARALKNVCLSLLLKVDNAHRELAKQQFDSSDNMTDTLGALTALNSESSTERSQLMSRFETRWIETPLAMDKWFSLHATYTSNDCIDQLEQLLQHDGFSMSNPNRVRSLIGIFAAVNTLEFHRKDAKGYEFLTKAIIKLNKVNPQVAARIITPLIQFKKFDLERQTLMRKSLQDILAIDELSKDLYEKVTKALS
ncbi:MAG: aminopeptidase N [Shewanella sp.]|jgi:aminopeptidase N